MSTSFEDLEYRYIQSLNWAEHCTSSSILVRRFLRDKDETIPKDLRQRFENITECFKGVIERCSVELDQYDSENYRRINGRHIADSFRFFIAPDIQNGNYFSFNGINWDPPRFAEKDNEEERLGNFMSWLIYRTLSAAKCFGNQLSDDVISHYRKALMGEAFTFSEDSRTLASYFKDKKWTKINFEKAASDCSLNLSDTFYAALQTNPQFFGEKLFEVENAEVGIEKIEKFLIDLKNSEKFDSLPLINILRMMTFSAYAKANDWLRMRLYSFFEKDNKYNINQTRQWGVKYRVELHNQEFDVEQRRSFDIFFVKDDTRVTVAQFILELAIFGDKKRSKASMRLRDWKFQKEVKAKKCYEVVEQMGRDLKKIRS